MLGVCKGNHSDCPISKPTKRAVCFFFQEMLTMLRFGLSVLLLSSVEVGFLDVLRGVKWMTQFFPSMVQCEIQTVKGVCTYYGTFGEGKVHSGSDKT